MEKPFLFSTTNFSQSLSSLMKMTFIVFACSAALVLGSAFADLVNLPDLEARVAKGDPEAELDLGRAYHVGNQGVPKDFAKAADL